MKSGKTSVTILLDRSGSMSTIRDDMIGGLNTLLEDQKKVPGEATYTLLQFDTPPYNPGSMPMVVWGGIPVESLNYENFPETVYEDVPEDKVPSLTRETFVPQGGTALLDAACIAIDKLGQKLASLDEKDRPSQVLFVIITDGQENESKKFTREDLKTRIQHQESVYGWKFIFLAAGQDAIAVGQTYGLSAASCETYMPTSVGVKQMYGTAFRSVSMAKAASATCGV